MRIGSERLSPHPELDTRLIMRALRSLPNGIRLSRFARRCNLLLLSPPEIFSTYGFTMTGLVVSRHRLCFFATKNQLRGKLTARSSPFACSGFNRERTGTWGERRN